jgi:hypothetical protein
MYLNGYMELLDWTGRAIRDDKRGHIPEDIPPILARLGIDPQQWLTQMQPRGNRFGRAIGRLDNLKAHASALGQRWIKGQLLSSRLYADA